VDIFNPTDSGCNHVGVKNAWIEKSKSNEIPVYVHKKESKLDIVPDPEFRVSSRLKQAFFMIFCWSLRNVKNMVI
jgi:hypothetical protein